MPARDPKSLIKVVGEILDCIPDYVGIIDEDRKIHFVNKALHEMVDAEMKEIIDQYCNIMVHGLIAPPKECPLLQSIRTGEPQKNEYYSREHDVWYSLEIYPMNIEIDGKKTFLHIARDISDKKRFEDAILRVNNIGEFYLDLLTHDISNMVQPILSYLQLLNEIPELNMKYGKFISIPLEEAKRISKLTKIIRRLSLHEPRKHIIVTVYMKEEIEKCIEEMNRQFPEKNINVIFSHDSYLGPIDICNEFMNPIFKICRYITKLSDDRSINLQITLKLNKNEELFYLTATGDGPAFNKGFLDKYFDRYYDGVFKKEGLGYDIAFYQELLRRLGSDIHLEPDLVRKGKVKVVIILPVNKAECFITTHLRQAYL